MIRLTDEEIAKAIDEVYYKGTGTYSVNIADKSIAKAQLKKVHSWGDELCDGSCRGVPRAGLDWYIKKRECRGCWQALLEEIK